MTTATSVRISTPAQSTWTVFATWLVVIILILAVFCTMLGSSLGGVLISASCLLVVLYLLLPPVYDSPPDQPGTGKWVYEPNGAVRFEPNMLAHAEATQAHVTPRTSPLNNEKKASS